MINVKSSWGLAGCSNLQYSGMLTILNQQPAVKYFLKQLLVVDIITVNLVKVQTL